MPGDSDEAGHGGEPEDPGAGERDLAGGEVALGGAGVFGVKFFIDDAVEGHGAGASAKDSGDDEEEQAPAGPAAGFKIARGDDH